VKQPSLQTWTDEPVRLVEQSVATHDPDPKALAAYGLLLPSIDELWLRFVDGRPVSVITTQFLADCCQRLAARGMTALLLVWDNSRWRHSAAHTSRPGNRTEPRRIGAIQRSGGAGNAGASRRGPSARYRTLIPNPSAARGRREFIREDPEKRDSPSPAGGRGGRGVRVRRGADLSPAHGPPMNAVPAQSQPIHGVRLLHDQKVPMRDGIRLSADVYLPMAPGPFPTILTRTP